MQNNTHNYLGTDKTDLWIPLCKNGDLYYVQKDGHTNPLRIPCQTEANKVITQ